MNAALLKSERMDWNTPQVIVDLVRAVGGGEIKLDPCSNENSIVGAEVSFRFDHGQDGLKLPWYTDGLVYVNPPYGREIGPWIERCAKYGAETDVIALVPARTDTKWFQTCWKAAGICFVRGRLTFLGAPSPAPFPSALVHWGPSKHTFAMVCIEAGLGPVIHP
jgi:hypothetical protein